MDAKLLDAIIFMDGYSQFDGTIRLQGSAPSKQSPDESYTSIVPAVPLARATLDTPCYMYHMWRSDRGAEFQIDETEEYATIRDAFLSIASVDELPECLSV